MIVLYWVNSTGILSVYLVYHYHPHYHPPSQDVPFCQCTVRLSLYESTPVRCLAISPCECLTLAIAVILIFSMAALLVSVDQSGVRINFSLLNVKLSRANALVLVARY